MRRPKQVQPVEPVGLPKDDIQKAFTDIGNQNELAKVLKELFDPSKIHMITDLTADEIKLCTRIFMLADMKDIDVWNLGLAFYLKLALSKDRRSRREVIDAFKGVRHEGFMSRMNPMNWGGRRM